MTQKSVKRADEREETILLVLKATIGLPLHVLELNFIPVTKDKLSLTEIVISDTRQYDAYTEIKFEDTVKQLHCEKCKPRGTCKFHALLLLTTQPQTNFYFIFGIINNLLLKRSIVNWSTLQ